MCGGGSEPGGAIQDRRPAGAVLDAVVDDVERLVHLAPVAGRLSANDRIVGIPQPGAGTSHALMFDPLVFLRWPYDGALLSTTKVYPVVHDINGGTSGDPKESGG